MGPLESWCKATRINMVRLLCIVGLWMISSNVASQLTGSITPDQSIVTLGKVWGFLKYYHPQVASGKIDWDQELVTSLPKVQQLTTREELSHFLLTLLNQLGPVKPCRTCSDSDSLRFSRNLDLGWLDDSTTLTIPLSQQLHYIAANRNQQKNQYVHWNPFRNRLEFNEQSYSQMAFPNQTYRLVGLLRYWNIIQYFHPDKYLIGRDWKDVLTDFVPKFRQVRDTLGYQLVLRQLISSPPFVFWLGLIDYQLVLRQLISTIQDGHAELSVPDKFRVAQTEPWLVPPFYYQLVEDTLLVMGSYSDSLSRLNDIQRGDRIVGIDGKLVSQCVDKHSSYASASNQSAKNQQVGSFLLGGTASFVTLQVIRQGQLLEKKVQRYTFQSFGYHHPNNVVARSNVMPPGIGYVDLGQLEVSDVKRVMSQFNSTKGIIFDVRRYPKGTFQRLGDYLNSHPTGFARYTKPDLTFPGMFKFGSVRYTGRDNDQYYQGKVAILCNSYTQSAAESTCVALRTAPNAKIIGSQSAGANGDVSYVTFPGNYQTRFTGTGVYSVDGRPIQRNGVPIDIAVKPTCEDVLSGTDKALQTAIDWINQ